MRDPEQIAADLEREAKAWDQLGGWTPDLFREAAEALRETLKEAESWENQYNELLDTVGGVWPH